MRTFVSMTSLALASVGIFTIACGATSSSCDELLTCGGSHPKDGGSGGASGSSGGAGAGGNGGKAGSTSSAGGAGGASTPRDGGVDAQTPADGGPDAADAPPPCDVTKDPSAESCLVTDTYAVFVAPGGTGLGTKGAPVGTVAQGVAYAKQLGLSRVIVCDATYDESLSLSGSSGQLPPDLRIFGGFHCPSEDGGAAWAPEIGVHAVLAPAAAGPALTITGVTTPVVIQDVDFTARDGTAGNPSSIAAVVSGSTSVRLRQVNVTAGKGADGAKGADGTKGADGADVSDAQKGTAASCTSPPAVQSGGFWTDASSCGSQGGLGGSASKNGDGTDGASGSPSTNVVAPGTVNKGLAGEPGTDGTIGSNGLDGSPAPVASTAGSFTSASFTPADGSAGTDGHAGQGGGGGGASKGSATCVGASGGAGGMGGCGGTHGEGGKGGGASVALLVSSSTVSLESVTLTSRSGGKGGDGGSAGPGGGGNVGASGGNGDAGHAIQAAGGGGRGGNGGNAGPGSGGTGGPSYAIVALGVSTLTKGSGVTLAPGAGGDKGLGGTVLGVGGTNPALDGTAGLAGPELDVP